MYVCITRSGMLPWSQCMRVCHNCHGWSDPGSWRWYSLSESTWEALKIPNFSGEACSRTPLVASAFSTEVLANVVCPCCALASAVFWVWWHCLLGAQIFSPPYFLWQAERKSVIPYVHFELKHSPPYQCWTHVLNLAVCTACQFCLALLRILCLRSVAADKRSELPCKQSLSLSVWRYWISIDMVS